MVTLHFHLPYTVNGSAICPALVGGTLVVGGRRRPGIRLTAPSTLLSRPTVRESATLCYRLAELVFFVVLDAGPCPTSMWLLERQGARGDKCGAVCVHPVRPLQMPSAC